MSNPSPTGDIDTSSERFDLIELKESLTIQTTESTLVTANCTVSSSTTSAESPREKFELDLHELSSFYTVDCPTLIKEDYGGPQSVLIALKFSKSTDSSAKTEHELELLVDINHRQQPPRVRLLQQSTLNLFLRQPSKDSAVSVCEEGWIDEDLIKRLYDSPNTAERDLLTVVNNMISIIQRAKEKSKSAVILRDFAYPVHDKFHWAQYDLQAGSAMQKVRALYDFEAQGDNELAFNVGDVIEIVYKQDKGWSVGIMNGICGLIPDSYVELIK